MVASRLNYYHPLHYTKHDVPICDAANRLNYSVTINLYLYLYTLNMNNLTENNTYDINGIIYPEPTDVSELVINVYPSVIDQDHTESWKLSEIVYEIRTNSTLADMVSQVRTAPSHEDVKALKKLLPVYRPCSYNDSFTGLIQFDIDVYNIENSSRLKKLLIENVPSLVYAFISPSGGLKMAVLTDITTIDKEIYPIAYYIAKDQVTSLLSCCAGDSQELVIEYDDRMKTMSYLCYMSYDPDAYFNPAPSQRMALSRGVNIKIIESTTSSETTVQAPSTTTINATINENDKAVSLRAITAIAENKDVALKNKTEKIKFSNAVVNVFGLVDGFDIILNTVRLFGNDTGYLKSIIKQGSNFGVGTIKYYAKRCGFKETTETFRDNSTSGNTERFEYVSKDTSRPKRYSTEEAIRLIDESVQRFFDNGVSTQLIVEMGIGKTEITLKKAIEHMDRCEKSGEMKKIAVFVPSHKLGHESLKKLFGFETEEPVGDPDDEGEHSSLGPKRTHKVIGGFGKHCHKLRGVPEEERKGLIRNPWECEHCEHDDHCWYIYQFFYEDNLIRIYPHNFLYKPSNYDKNYHPDYVIIDEDPTGHCIIERTYGRDSGGIWKKILDEGGLDAINLSDISSAIKLLKLQIDGAKCKLTSAGGGPDRSSLMKYSNLLGELDDLSILMNEKWKVSVYDNKVHLPHKQEIDKKWLNAPVLYLNGTGTKEISSVVFGPDKFKITKEIRVQYNPSVKLYQVMNQTFSMSQFEDPEDGKGERLKQDVYDLISYFYHYTGACFVSYSSIIQEYLAKHQSCDPERFMYFGDTRGKKAFENNSIIVVIGRHCVPHQALATKAKMLFGDEADIIDESLCLTKRIIELHDEEHDAEVSRQDFNDQMMRLMSKNYNEGEVLQSIHRLRLLHGTDPKTVVYLSNFVLDGLCVDRLIIRDDVLLNENRMKLVKAVQEHGIIEGKPRTIAKRTGLTSTQVSNLKNKKWFSDNPFFFVDERGRLIDRYMHQ
jgi:hypothetical protein